MAVVDSKHSKPWTIWTLNSDRHVPRTAPGKHRAEPKPHNDWLNRVGEAMEAPKPKSAREHVSHSHTGFEAGAL